MSQGYFTARGSTGTVTLSNGMQLAYSDSGAPAGLNDYETLIMAHGCGVNKEAFRPLLRARDTCKLRIITYNQRGYAGSTPLSEGERTLTGDRVQMARDYVEDLILFVEYWRPQLPRKPIVVGWSKGTYLLMGVAHPSFVSRELRAKALRDFAGLVLYEPPGSLVSNKPTADLKIMNLADKSKKGTDSFMDWAMGFYKPGADKFYDNSKVLLSPSMLRAAKTPSMVHHGFYWATAPSSQEQRQFAADAFAAKDFPLVVVHNGESPPYILEACKTAKKMGAPTSLLYGGGNHFAFAHEPERWLISLLHSFGKVAKTSKL